MRTIKEKVHEGNKVRRQKDTPMVEVIVPAVGLREPWRHGVECLQALSDHDYCVRRVNPKDLPKIKEQEKTRDAATTRGFVASQSLANYVNDSGNETTPAGFTKKFSKCDKCRRSRTKVLVPDWLLSVAHGKNDGVTCDFCGDVMHQPQPRTLPGVFEGRRGSKGGGGEFPRLPKHEEDEAESVGQKNMKKRKSKKKNYVYCGECGKVVLKESLMKHMRDVHELSNKKQCNVCGKTLSGPFSLKEHVNAVHNKQTRHCCSQCGKQFAHFSNMNRHIRLMHNKMVVTHRYVDCPVCGKVVQSTSLKKHLSTIHERRRDFKCSYCEKSFAQSYTLKEHTAAKHMFQYGHHCKLCGKAFAHKTNCGRHLKTVHRKEVASKFASEQDMIKQCVSTNSAGDPSSKPGESSSSKKARK